MNTRQTLITELKRLAVDRAETLDQLRQHAAEVRAKPDWLWHELLVSFATWGNSRGWDGLIGDKENYNALAFDALATLSAEARAERVLEVCRRAKIRMPDKKATMLCHNFDWLHARGGPADVGAQVLAHDSAKAVCAHLEKLAGVGPKYSRNIMMSIDEPRFRWSIAIDHRIKKILTLLEVSGSYVEQEAFLLEVAREAGIDGWTLDRLIYWFLEELLETLKGSDAHG